MSNVRRQNAEKATILFVKTFLIKVVELKIDSLFFNITEKMMNKLWFITLHHISWFYLLIWYFPMYNDCITLFVILRMTHTIVKLTKTMFFFITYHLMRFCTLDMINIFENSFFLSFTLYILCTDAVAVSNFGFTIYFLLLVYNLIYFIFLGKKR